MLALLRGVLTSLTLLLSTCVLTCIMVVPSLLKLVLPFSRLRQSCDLALTGLASTWVEINNFWIEAVCPVAWDVQVHHRRYPQQHGTSSLDVQRGSAPAA